MKFVRYAINNSVKYGLIEGNPIQKNENFYDAIVKELDKIADKFPSKENRLIEIEVYHLQLFLQLVQ